MVNKEIPYPFGIDEIRFMRCFSAPSYRIFVGISGELSVWEAKRAAKERLTDVLLHIRLN